MYKIDTKIWIFFGGKCVLPPTWLTKSGQSRCVDTICLKVLWVLICSLLFWHASRSLVIDDCPSRLEGNTTQHMNRSRIDCMCSCVSIVSTNPCNLCGRAREPISIFEDEWQIQYYWKKYVYIPISPKKP